MTDKNIFYTIISYKLLIDFLNKAILRVLTNIENKNNQLLIQYNLRFYSQNLKILLYDFLLYIKHTIEKETKYIKIEKQKYKI